MTAPTPDLEKAIVDLVARDAVNVPPYPAVALQLDRLVGSGDYGVDDLARLVASDQVLAADVLRCANSAGYARGEPVASVKAAVARIGAHDVVRVALASGLGRHALAPGKLQPLRRLAWREALASALLAQALARGRGLQPDVAFSAGLLHDVGRVVALACVEDLLAAWPAFPPRAEAEWRATVDRFHVELGVVTAARWGLPPVLADVVSLHHAESVAGAADPALVEVVAAVDQVVALLGDRTHLSAEDLGVVSLLAARECELVANALVVLPGFVASFEGGEAVAPAPSLVATPPPPRPAGPIPLPFPLELAFGGKSHAYRVLGIASTHAMVSGAEAAPENLLAQLTIGCEPPLTGFGSVKLCWPEGSGYTLLVQPYALSGEAQARWRELVALSTGT